MKPFGQIVFRYGAVIIGLIPVTAVGVYLFRNNPSSAAIFTLSILLIGVIHMLLASYKLASQARELDRAMQAVAEGRLEQHLEVPPRGEFVVLFKQFNQMSDRLRLQRQRHADHADALQQSVAEGEKALKQLRAELAAHALAGEERGKSEARVESLLEYSSDIITTLDNMGRIQYASPSVERVLGHRMEDVLGKKMFDFVHPDDLHTAMTAYVRAFQEPGKPSALQFRFRHRDGSWRHMEAICNNLLLVPSVGAVIINYRDFTERKRLEEQLTQTQKMETIGRLAGGVAHDFNNLLLVIMEYARFAKRSLSKDDRAYDDIDQVLVAADRAAGLTRQLLAFSRRQIIEPRVVKVNELIVNMEKMLRRLIGEDVTLTVKPGADLPPVRVDPGQIEQVIMNLVVNARDAMPRGGAIVIETAQVVLDPAAVTAWADVTPGSFVQLAISDTGTGMTAEVKAHLFEPFFTTKELGKGTGLGLATVYGIVKQHQGNLVVESEEGKGATFRVYLPSVLEAKKAAEVEAELKDLPRGTETVLLVEDEPMVRELAARMIREFGYQVVETEDGPEALSVAEKYAGGIHLLLTDVVMPGMNGDEVAAKFLLLRPAAKVIFMSGYTDESIARHGVLDPGRVLVKKPFAPDVIACRIREILDAG